MASDWPSTSLRNAGVTLIDCDHRTPPAANSGYPYVAIPQLKKGRLEISDARRISQEHFIDWTRKAKPKHHDVIVSRRCNPGETAYVSAGLEFALGQNLVLLRSDGTKLFPPFLRWVVRSPYWWEQIAKYINVGAIFDSLRCADIPNFEVPLPPLSEQKAIAHILGSLDDKIEINRRMNETLEAMACALFKSWFIDFDPVRAKADGRTPEGMDEATARLFPDSFEESELGENPKGWTINTLAALTIKIGSGATPRGGSKVYVSDGISFIRSQNVHDNDFSWDGLAQITEEAAHELRNVIVRLNDVLINITGDSILRTCVVDPAALPARVSQHVAIIRAKEGVPPRFIHQFLVRPQTKDILLGFDSGGSRKAVTKGHLESLQVPTPPSQILDLFDRVTEPLFKRVTSHLGEIKILSDLRDALLPRLLTGKFRIKDAERFIEAAL